MSGRIFAIGDIHGCFKAFRTLVEEKIKPDKDDMLILLGDYIDRGKQSKEVVEFIMDLIQKGFVIIPLMGNHEGMLLDSLKDERNIWLWIQNGGYETICSFGLQSLDELDEKYVAFFKELKLYHSFGNFLFVHAGFNDDLEDPFTDRNSILWSRNEVYKNQTLKEKIIIHGHTPITVLECEKRVSLRKQILNLDTGCVFAHSPGYGQLTALEIGSYELLSVANE